MRTACQAWLPRARMSSCTGGSRDVPLLLGCSTSPLLACPPPLFPFPFLFPPFLLLLCVSTHVQTACVCRCAQVPLEAGGCLLSSITSHFSLHVLSLLLVCVRERDGSGDQKTSFGSHFFPPTVGIELTRVIRLGWQAPLPAEHLEGPLPYLLRSLLTLGLIDLERLPCY